MSFDFQNHKITAINEYVRVRPIYEKFTDSLKNILSKVLNENKISFHSIEARAKDIESFGEKSIKHSDENPSEPKYLKPLDEITDLAGVRIITFFPKTIDEIDKLLHSQFHIIEKNDKSEILKKEEKLGYHSIHYLVKFNSKRVDLPEYQNFENLIAEIQVRTILQHAWAEIEHDIKYKSTILIPQSIKRRLISLAGLLEIADREFQSIQDDDKKLKSEGRKLVKLGKFNNISITPDSLKNYLDKKLGKDARISSFSYTYQAKDLIKMGFKTLDQIDDCISDFIDNTIVESAVWGNRQGQLWRFEDYLLAGLGEQFIKLHPRIERDKDWTRRYKNGLKKMVDNGVKISTYSINI